MTKQFFVAILIILVSIFSIQGQPSYEERLYLSFISGNMTDWVKVIDELERELRHNSTDSQRFKLLHAQYGYIGYLLGIKQVDKAKRFITSAEANAQQLENSTSFSSTVKAIKSALIAYRISISPYKAPFLGPESMNLINEALEIDPNNFFAIIEKANARHYAPSIVGGNPSEAIGLYEKALKLIRESNNGTPPKTWWYINTYTQMGLAAQKAGNTEKAKTIYLEILKYEPQYLWVKNELLPEIS